MEVEISLRIPAVKDPLKDASGWPVNHADVRFVKRIVVDKLPKPDEVLDLTINPNHPFQARVVQSHWHEEKQLFVVACRYAKTSIPRPEYLAIMEDPEWKMTPLLG